MPIRRGWSSVADIVTLALEELEHRGGADALALAGRSVSGEADGTALIAEEQAIPTWRPRSYLTEETPVGKPYRWNGQVYRLWQQHDATGQPGWSRTWLSPCGTSATPRTPPGPRTTSRLRAVGDCGRRESAVCSADASGVPVRIGTRTVLANCRQAGRI